MSQDTRWHLASGSWLRNAVPRHRRRRASAQHCKPMTNWPNTIHCLGSYTVFGIKDQGQTNEGNDVARVVIGRSPRASIQLSHERDGVNLSSVSRFHATIIQRRNTLKIHDGVIETQQRPGYKIRRSKYGTACLGVHS